MIDPIDKDPEVLKQKDKKRAYWEQFSAWRKGYKAGKKGVSLNDNPYKLDPDIWKLLQKRARWELGRQDGDALRHRREIARKKRKNKHKKKRRSK